MSQIGGRDLVATGIQERAKERLRQFPGFHRLATQEWIVAVVLWVILTCFSISYSYALGKLSMPIGWDDTVYLNDAYTRLQTFYQKGLGGVLKEYVRNTPHSPLSSGLALASFVLFGVHDLSPYLLNSLLALVLLIYALKFFSSPTPLVRWFAAGYLCMIPLASTGIMEFRPDFAASLFVALGILVSISQPLVNAERWRLIEGGALFGLAILAKPTFVPYTVFIWAGSVSAALACDFYQKSGERSFRRAATSVLIHGGTITVLGAIHLAFGGREIVSYIRMVMFSPQTSTFTAPTRGNFIYQAAYYLTGDGGKQMLGRNLWVLCLWIAVAICLLPCRSKVARLRWLCFLLLTFVSYLFFAVNPAKGPEWGLPFQILLAFGALAAFQSVLDLASARGWPWLSGHAIVAAWILPGLAFLQPWFPRYGISRVPFADFIFEAHHRIIEDVAKQRPLAPIIVNLTAAGDINTDSLNWVANKRGLAATFTSDFFFGNLESRQKQAEDADLIVAPEFGAPGFYKTQASTKEADLMLQFLQGDPRFLAIDAIPAVALGGKSIFVFINRPFRGWTAQSGIGNVQGPSKKRRLPRGRWAAAGRAILVPEGLHAGTLTLSGSALAPVKDQKMEVAIGERHLGTVEFPEPLKVEKFSFSATLDDPTQPIILTLSSKDEAGGATSKAVLLQSLILTNTAKKAQPE